MITIISATNRSNSNTLKIAKCYEELMKNQGVVPKLLSLESLPIDIAFNELYGKRSQEFQKIETEFIIPANKFVFIVPEYQGSIPGILKVFLDALPPDQNRNKKAVLIGISTGRAGNLRGMDHLTTILHYLGIHVHPNKQPISQVANLLDLDGKIKDENTLKVLNKQITDFLNW